MPTFDVTSPDGRKFRINAPEGATQDQALAFAKQHMPEAAPKPEGTSDPMTGEIKGALGDIGSAVSPENIEKGRILGVLPKAPVDLAMGLLRLGSAPATVAMHGAGQAGSAATGGFLKPEEVESALSVGMPGKKLPTMGAPSLDALRTAYKADYKRAENLGVQIRPQALTDLHNDIKSTLIAQGHRDFNQPGTFSAIKELAKPQGAPAATISDLESVRSALLDTKLSNPQEAAAAQKAINKIDDYWTNIPPHDDLSGTPGLAWQAGKILKQARGNVAAYERANTIEQARTSAERRARVTGSGVNIDNTTRQNLNRILEKIQKGKAKGFSDEEIAAMERVVRGTAVGNTARMVGKLAPTGAVSALPSIMVGGPAGVGMAAAGTAGKALGDYTTKRGVERLSEMLRSRSPLGPQMTQPQPSAIDAYLRKFYPAAALGSIQDQNQ